MPEKLHNGTVGRVTATRAARRAITALHAVHGGPVMFVQSAGCCDGSAPMCFPHGEFALGDGDMLVLGVFRPAGSPAEAYYPDGTLAVVPER